MVLDLYKYTPQTKSVSGWAGEELFLVRANGVAFDILKG